MDGFRDGYEFFSQHAEAYVASEDAERWIESIEQAVDAFVDDMASFEGTAKRAEILAGDVAEFWHADTYNIDLAVHRSTSPRAEVPRSTGFGTPDIVIGDKNYQVKFYADADASIKAQSITFGESARRGSPSAQALIDGGLVGKNDPVYGDMGRVIPSDQLESGREAADRRIAQEALRRPEQVARYRSTRDRLAGRVGDGKGNSSRDLTRADANRLANEAKAGEIDLENWGLTPSQIVRLGDVVRQAARAGLSAAALAAVLESAPAVIAAAQHLIEEGLLDFDELSSAGTSALSGGARGFLAGSATAALTATAGMGLLGETAAALDPMVIGAVALVMLNTLRNSALVVRGQMDRATLASSLGRDMLVTTCSLVGAGIGQGMVQVPVVGYLLGSLVGSVIGGVSWAAAERVTAALCVEDGLTFFGLVDQNYELPREVLNQIGIEVFDYEEFLPDSFRPGRFIVDTFSPDSFEPIQFAIRPLRRGVFDIGRIGYLSN